MTEEEYNGYSERAEYCNYTGRTIEGCHGIMFRKELTVEVPESLKPYLENVDGKGHDLYKFVNDGTYDSMITSWGGILVDVPNGEDVSVKVAEENGILPYLTYFQAEKIINVQTKTIGRKEVVTMVVIKDSEEVITTDRFTTETKDRYKVFELDENGIYTASVFNESYQLISQVQPKMFGKPIDFIPFFFCPSVQPSVPMFMSLVEVNKAWYHKSADLENGLHWTGIPTPYAIGLDPPTHTDSDGNQVADAVKLGGHHFLFFPQGTSAVNFLEFSGAGLSQLQSAMDKDEERMAILGARIISQERKGVESAETAKIHRAGENSVVATFAMEMSKVFTNALRCLLEWTVGYEIAEDIKVEINTDYDVVNMSAQELTALVSAWQSGGISKKILFKNLKEGELIPAETEFEEMEEEIQIEQEQNMLKAVESASLMAKVENNQ